MCKCCDFGEYKCYKYVKIPKHMNKYKNNRQKEGFSNKIGIDKCILKEIRYLWSRGVKTYNSCCGHGKIKSSVAVSLDSIDRMKKLGYKNDPQFKDSDVENQVFNLKYKKYFEKYIEIIFLKLFIAVVRSEYFFEISLYNINDTEAKNCYFCFNIDKKWVTIDIFKNTLLNYKWR